jgi:phosphoserine phosphatase
VDSAAGIARTHGLEPAPLEWLLEINHGIIEGMNDVEANAVAPGLIDAWRNRPHTVDFPGGETLEEVRQRVAGGIWETYNRDNGTVVFVTHQVVTGVARCIIEDRPLSEVWSSKLLNGKYYRAELSPAAIERIAAHAARRDNKEAQ